MSGSRYHKPRTAGASPVSKVYRVEQVIEELKKRIEKGAWTGVLPGERPLSTALNVSRPVLREALSILESQNWIQRNSKGRPVIGKIKKNQIIDAEQLQPLIVHPSPTSSMPASSVEMLRHTEDELMKLGFSPRSTLYRERKHTTTAAALAALRAQYPDSVWLLRSPSAATLDWCAKHEIPCCIMGAQPKPNRFPGVDLDIERVVIQSIEYLKNLGHSKVFFLHPRGDTHGLKKMLRVSRDIDGIHIKAIALPSNDNSEALEITKKMLLDNSGFTACICTYYQHYLAVTTTLTAAGARLPRDLSALCLYPDPLMEWSYGGVTHFKLDPKQAGLRMASIMHKLLLGQTVAPKSTVYFPSFCEGASCTVL